MKYLFRGLLVILFCLSCMQQSFARGNTDSILSNFNLIPQPQKVALLLGNGISFRTLKGIHLSEGTERPILYGILKTLPLSSEIGDGVLSLEVSSDKELPESAEGYILRIEDGQVSIKAKTQAGLFYGCQTLLQLLSDARDQQIAIPACQITDYPSIAYRAVHLDMKHHMTPINYYYKIIDKLARIKVNAVIIELEDKLRYSVPDVASPNAISIQQFQALSRYAHERNISISPLVQGLGHASYILKHDRYKHLREDSTSDWAFSPLDSGTYKILFSLYKEAIAATPYGKYLHIGGDEVGSLGTSKLSKQSGMSPFELQMYWLDKVCKFAQAHNRIPIFWDDMVFKSVGLYQTTYKKNMPEKEVDRLWKKNKGKLDNKIQLFPKNCVYMRWQYYVPTALGNIKALDWYKSHDLKVMAATAAQTTWMLLPRQHSNYQSIKDFCKITAEKNLEGILCTAWEDSSPLFETYWRGFYFFSEFSWNDKDIPLEQAEALFRKRFYGPALGASSYEFEDLLEQNLNFWENALMRSGNRRKNKNIQLIDLPKSNDKGAWSEQHQTKIAGAKKAVNLYQKTKKRIALAMNKANRNRYSISYFNQLNELQIYPAKLLLLMDDYDLATKDKKDEKLAHLLDYVNSFHKIRKHFEDVFSETRMLNKPKGYLMDSNSFHNHWANTTLNSDWMYLIELRMNKKIRKWAMKLGTIPSGFYVTCGDNKVVILNPKLGNDTSAIVWKWMPMESKNQMPAKYQKLLGTLDDCKPVDHNKELLITASSGATCLLRIKDKKVMFYAKTPMAHSADMLPGGYIAVANSTNPKGNSLELYNEKYPEKVLQKDTLYFGHGVVWNKKRQQLFVLGNNQLRIYELEKKGKTKRLVREKTIKVPYHHSHDLSPIDKNRLLITNPKTVNVFNVNKESFYPFKPLENVRNVKSVNYNPKTKHLVYTKAEISWWTHHIYSKNPKGKISIPNINLYKVRLVK